MGSLPRAPIKRIWPAAVIGLAVVGTSWGFPALSEAREQVLRFLNAPLVDPHALERRVPGPRSVELGQEPSRLKPSASETPAPPPTGTPATGPLALAPSPRSPEQPRESIRVTKPDQRKAKPPRHAMQVKERDREALDETTTYADLDGSLIDAYFRESDARMEACLSTSVKRGPVKTADIPFLIDFDGTVHGLSRGETGERPEVARCVEAYRQDAERIKLPRSLNQRVIHRPFEMK